MTPQANTGLLHDKNAVIFGGTGAVGAAIAAEFSAQGASVFLSGRSRDSAERVADDIRGRGGSASAAVVDALDEGAIDAYLDGLASEHGRIDVVINAMGPQPRDYGNGTPTMDLPLEQFMVPLTTIVPSQFLTARSAARQMMRQRSGVIVFLSGIPSRGLAANVAAIGATFGALESLMRGLATELGPTGIRVCGIRTGGMVDTRTMEQTFENVANTTGMAKDQVATIFEQKTLLKRIPTLADTATLAAFLASDQALTLTGTIVNASSGAVLD